jgi:hypothetical protein
MDTGLVHGVLAFSPIYAHCAQRTSWWWEQNSPSSRDVCQNSMQPKRKHSAVYDANPGQRSTYIQYRYPGSHVSTHYTHMYRRGRVPDKLGGMRPRNVAATGDRLNGNMAPKHRSLDGMPRAGEFPVPIAASRESHTLPRAGFPVPYSIIGSACEEGIGRARACQARMESAAMPHVISGPG